MTQTKHGDRPLVLIVEDSPAIQRIVAMCLEPEHATAAALDGESALAQALELHPDLVLVDLHLPIMDGEELVHTMRKHRALAHVPVIMISGSQDPRLLRLLESEVQDVLHKPFVVAELRARVRNLLANKRTLDLLNDTVGRHETDLVKLATQVAEHQRNLERALTELDEARRVAERANQIKSNFLRMMSHELKTPITAMQLHMRLLEREAEASGIDRFNDGMERMTRSSKRLLHLVDTILEWGRVESGRFQLSVQDVDLGELVSDVVDELAGYAKQKRIALDIDIASKLPLLTGDPRVVGILLRNLIGRALQVTDEGTVRVEVCYALDGHRVRVSDESPPLGAEEEQQLFDPLGAVNDLHRVGGTGSGLGLHVVRDIASAVDGEISLERGAARGNTFALRLPRLDAERTTGRIPVGEFAGRLRAER
jgi:signal transduction histidine kinase